jgi:hypothetical protein
VSNARQKAMKVREVSPRVQLGVWQLATVSPNGTPTSICREPSHFAYYRPRLYRLTHSHDDESGAHYVSNARQKPMKVRKVSPRVQLGVWHLAAGSIRGTTTSM